MTLDADFFYHLLVEIIEEFFPSIFLAFSNLGCWL